MKFARFCNCIRKNRTWSEESKTAVGQWVGQMDKSPMIVHSYADEMSVSKRQFWRRKSRSIIGQNYLIQRRNPEYSASVLTTK